MLQLTLTPTNSFTTVVRGVPDGTLALSAVLRGQAGAVGSLAWADITGKPSTFAPSAHTHPATDITGLSSGASPGGTADGQVQLRGSSGTTLEASADLTFDTAAKKLTVGGPVVIPQASNAAAPNNALFFESAANNMPAILAQDYNVHVRANSNVRLAVGLTYNSGSETHGAYLGGTNTGVWFTTDSNSSPGTQNKGLAPADTNTLEVNNGNRTANGGALRDLKVRGLIWGSAYTVATLPSASTAGDGATFRVSDLSGAALGAAPSGGGSTKGLVTSNGTSYTVTQFG